MTTKSQGLSHLQIFIVQQRRWVLLALALLALLYPFWVPPYLLSLAIQVLIFAIFAMSLDLLLGYTGLPSFGHAAFFGLGAYLVAYIASSNERALNLTSNLLITVPVVVSLTALVGLIVGVFALRTIGIYFLMITLAFAQMLFSIAISWSEVTGGSDGLPNVSSPSLGIGPLSYEFGSRESFYYLTLAFFLISWGLLHRLVHSPFGWTLRGIRENEGRMRALGYNTFYFKIAAFITAACFAGLAGLLLVHFFGHAAPEYLHWSTSGEVMIMLIVGGTGTLVGPVIGAAIVQVLPLYVSSYTDRWETVMGLIFILFVLFAPKGVVGLTRRRLLEKVEP